MPQDYKVTQVHGRDEWTGSHGPMVTYKLSVEGMEGVVELNQKPETAAPTPAQVIFGHMEEGKYSPRLKKDQRDGGGSFNPRSNGGKKQEWREDPDRQHRIVRQHSQTVGVALVEMAIGSGIVERPESSEALFELLRKTFDWLDKDVDAAVASRALSLDDAQRRSEDGF